jgi:hypothetical protein
MKRGGRLVIAIGCILLAFAVAIWARLQTVNLTEGQALTALWPAWLIVGGLAIGAAWLLRGVQ